MSENEAQMSLQIAMNQLVLAAAAIQAARGAPRHPIKAQIGDFEMTVLGNNIVVNCPNLIDGGFITAIRTAPYPPIQQECPCCHGIGKISSG